jgi:hypothetical protein
VQRTWLGRAEVCPVEVRLAQVCPSEVPVEWLKRCRTCDARHCARTAIVLFFRVVTLTTSAPAPGGDAKMATSYEDNFGFWEIACP